MPPDPSRGVPSQDPATPTRAWVETARRWPARLELGPEPRAALERLASSGYPDETCGLLVGRELEGRIRVERVEAARNRDRERSRDRYDLDPEDQYRIERAAEADGLEIVGVWHSHPDHPALPSLTDRDAAWEGYAYLIARVTIRGVDEVRAWRLDGEVFLEQTIAGEEKR